MEKKESFFENHPYVCYALVAALFFAFNLFLRRNKLDADAYIFSAVSTLMMVGAWVCGDKVRRKNKAMKDKIANELKKKYESAVEGMNSWHTDDTD